MFYLLDFLKLGDFFISKIKTFAPNALRESAKFKPINPMPPSIKIFLFFKEKIFSCLNLFIVNNILIYIDRL